MKVFNCVLALCAAGLGACGIPASIKLYAADLPQRADGQYAFIDDEDVKKGLIRKDAQLQCRIDEDDAAAASCQCANGSSDDWRSDCKSWLGAHVPPAPATPTTEPTPTDA